MLAFEQRPCGLYFYDAATKVVSSTLDDGMSIQNAYENGIAFLTKVGKLVVTFKITVAENMKNFSHRQITRSKEARRVYGMVGTPSKKDFSIMVRTNSINNCPITYEDIKIADEMWGTQDKHALQGKTV